MIAYLQAVSVASAYHVPECHRADDWSSRSGVSGFATSGSISHTHSSLPLVFHGQVTNNAAVGCENGIWYAMPIHPMSASATIHANDTWLQSLRTQPLLRHANNVVHGNQNGLLVDNGVDAATGLSQSSSYDPQVNGVYIGATFDGLLSYKNYGFGVWARGTYLTVNNPVLIDNHVGAFLPNGPSVVLGGVFEGRSPNVDPPPIEDNWWDMYGRQPQTFVAFELYDFGMQLVKNSVASHYDDPNTRALVMEDEFGTPARGGAHPGCVCLLWLSVDVWHSRWARLLSHLDVRRTSSVCCRHVRTFTSGRVSFFICFPLFWLSAWLICDLWTPSAVTWVQAPLRRHRGTRSRARPSRRAPSWR